MPGGPSTWYILDWDQRRIIAVTMDEEQESEDVAIGHLKKHIDALGPDVYAIYLSQDGDLVSVSTNPEDDETTCVYYPPLQAILLHDHVKTVLRSELLELDRLSPNVDLVSYTPCANATDTKAVFKYYFPPQAVERDELVDAPPLASKHCTVRPACARRTTWTCRRLYKPLHLWRHDRREQVTYV